MEQPLGSWPYLILLHMGVSKNRGTSKWMVYNGKLYENGWFGGYHYFWKHPYVFTHSSVSLKKSMSSLSWHWHPESVLSNLNGGFGPSLAKQFPGPEYRSVFFPNSVSFGVFSHSKGLGATSSSGVSWGKFRWPRKRFSEFCGRFPQLFFTFVS